jgi:MFS family permease
MTVSGLGKRQMSASAAVVRPAGRRDSAVPGLRAVPHLAGFWIVAVSYLALAAFGTAPTPFWPIYERADGFGPLVVTIAFAVMVLGIAASLATVGHLSDRLGRRRLIVPALGVGAAAATVMAVSPSLSALLVGRVLTGIAIGLMAATATAYLGDLYRQARPDSDASSVPGVVAGVAGLGGLAIGPLVSGTIGSLASAPLPLSYGGFALAMLVLLGLAVVTPETIDRQSPDVARPVRFALQPSGQRAFIAAAAVGFCAFGVSGLFSSLGSIIIRQQLHLTSVFIGGTGTLVVFAASAVAQIALRTLQPRTMMAIGAALFPVGLVLTVIALAHPTLWLFLTAAGIAGAGAGLLFKAGLTEAAVTASPSSRAGVLAVFFIVAYLGLGLPSVLFAIALQTLALIPTMIWSAATLTALTIASVLIGATRIRRLRQKGDAVPPGIGATENPSRRS